MQIHRHCHLHCYRLCYCHYHRHCHRYCHGHCHHHHLHYLFHHDEQEPGGWCMGRNAGDEAARWEYDVFASHCQVEILSEISCCLALPGYNFISKKFCLSLSCFNCTWQNVSPLIVRFGFNLKKVFNKLCLSLPGLNFIWKLFLPLILRL